VGGVPEGVGGGRRPTEGVVLVGAAAAERIDGLDHQAGRVAPQCGGVAEGIGDRDQPALVVGELDELDALGVPAFKIASFEIVDLPLVRYAAARGRPMIISTGLADYEDVQDVVSACRAEGNENVVLLQCASLYPAPPARINLRAMETMRRAFGVPVGLSDHTLGIHVSVGAAALGASVIEKHYTLSRTLKGPDHPFAIEPAELRELVRQVRDVEAALGDGRKLGPAPDELEMHQKARRSLVAARAIAKGAVIAPDMLTIKRPGFGIKPKHAGLVVGRVAKRDIDEDEVVTWDMV